MSIASSLQATDVFLLAKLMNIKRLKSHASGRLVETWYEDKSCLAFAPHPLPPNINLDDKDLFLATSDAHGALGELGDLGAQFPIRSYSYGLSFAGKQSFLQGLKAHKRVLKTFMPTKQVNFIYRG